MMAVSWNNGMNTCGYYRQCCGKHFSTAADSNATVEGAVFSMWPMPVLHNKDQLDKPPVQVITVIGLTASLEEKAFPITT